jgi:hypothetical protein
MADLMGAFAVWLDRFVPAGAPTAAQWIRIIQETTLLHPGRDPADGLFIRVQFDGERLTATAYRHCEVA